MKSDRLLHQATTGLLVILVCFGPLALGAVRAFDWLVIEALTVTLLILWTVRVFSSTDSIFIPPILLTALVGLLYVGAGAFLAPVRWVAAREWVHLLTYAVVFFIILNHAAKSTTVQTLCFSLIGLGAVVAAYGLFQVAVGSEHVYGHLRPPQYAGRASGTYICPNHFGGFLVMVAPLGFSYALLGRLGMVARILLVYASLLMLTGVAVSMSRGAWIAGAASLLVFTLVMLPRQRWRWAWLLIVLLLAAGTVGFLRHSLTARQRVDRSLQDGNRDSIATRLWLNQAALRMWLDAPWTGTGPGHFGIRFPAYRPQQIQGDPVYVHNDYLNTLTDLGAVGGFIGLVALVQLGFAGRNAWRFARRETLGAEAGQGNRSAFLAGAVSSLAGAAVHAALDFNLRIPANALVAVCLMALVVAHSRHATSKFRQRSTTPIRVLSLLAAAAISITLIFWGATEWREASWLASAEEYQVRIDTLKRQPWNNPDVQSDELRTLQLRKLDSLRQALEHRPLNHQTLQAIAELHRELSWLGMADFRREAWEAIHWSRLASAANPYDPYNLLHIGMSLDWLSLHAAAAPCYEQAIALDPRNYYLLALQGWHFVQSGQFDLAKACFKRSLELRWWDNRIARSHLELINRIEAQKRVPPPEKPAPTTPGQPN